MLPVWDASHVALRMRLPVAADLNFELRGQRVDDGCADTVQSPGDLVSAAAELAAGVQHGKDSLKRRLARLGVLVGGDAAAVVANLDPAAGLQCVMSIRVAWPAIASSTELSTIS